MKLPKGIYFDKKTTSHNKFKVVYDGRTIGRYYSLEEAVNARDTYIERLDRIYNSFNDRDKTGTTYIYFKDDRIMLTYNELSDIIDTTLKYKVEGDCREIFKELFESYNVDENVYNLNSFTQKELNKLVK